MGQKREQRQRDQLKGDGHLQGVRENSSGLHQPVREVTGEEKAIFPLMFWSNSITTKKNLFFNLTFVLAISGCSK